MFVVAPGSATTDPPSLRSSSAARMFAADLRSLQSARRSAATRCTVLQRVVQRCNALYDVATGVLMRMCAHSERALPHCARHQCGGECAPKDIRGLRRRGREQRMRARLVSAMMSFWQTPACAPITRSRRKIRTAVWAACRTAEGVRVKACVGVYVCVRVHASDHVGACVCAGAGAWVRLNVSMRACAHTCAHRWSQPDLRNDGWITRVV